jgi:chorismate synthase
MLRFLTAGESHGRGLVGMIEAFPAGLALSVDKINYHLARRQTGYGRGARMKIEKDRIEIFSGVRNGRTLGSPIGFVIENRDWANWEKIMHPERPIAADLSGRQRKLAYDVHRPRPGHADLSGAIKYGTHDLRNVLERASARETATRVACGSIARQLLEYFDIEIASHVIAIGSVKLKRKRVTFDEIRGTADDDTVKCVDEDTAKKMIDAIKEAIRTRDTIGGVFEIRVRNLPVGLGSNAQWCTRLDGHLAQALMSIQSVKGVEIGDGFANAAKPGSRVHDRIYYRQSGTESLHSKRFYRRTNAAGGIEGGMTNGEEIIVRGACKPISTLMQPLDTVDVQTKEKAQAIVERTDTCVVPAAAVVGEAMAAMVVAQAFVEKFGGDSLADIEASFNSYVQREF